MSRMERSGILGIAICLNRTVRLSLASHFILKMIIKSDWGDDIQNQVNTPSVCVYLKLIPGETWSITDGIRHESCETNMHTENCLQNHPQKDITSSIVNFDPSVQKLNHINLKVPFIQLFTISQLSFIYL